MSCSSCSRRTLSLFVRSIINADLILSPRATAWKPLRSNRSFSTGRGSRQVDDALTVHATSSSLSKHASKLPRERREQSAAFTVRDGFTADHRLRPRREKNEYTSERQSFQSYPNRERRTTDREKWQLEKAALKEKFGGQAWNPRKKLSPDAMEGIRHLHESAPDRFTTPILAQHFKVSPDAIRRILKSKWRPSDEEQEERLKRWDKRGEKIWSNLVELGVKPPKRWREMGVGRAEPGSRPKWKSDARNTVIVHDSFSEDLIPIVEKGQSSAKPSRWEDTSFSERLM